MTNIYTEQSILHYLKMHCRGIEEAVSRRVLAEMFNISPRELRRAKRNIVLNIDKHIGSTLNGYWYGVNDNEVEMFRADCLSRLREYKIMVDAYDSILPKNKDQMTMEDIPSWK